SRIGRARAATVPGPHFQSRPPSLCSPAPPFCWSPVAWPPRTSRPAGRVGSNRRGRCEGPEGPAVDTSLTHPLLHFPAHIRRRPPCSPPFKEAKMNQKTMPRSMFLVLGLALLLAAWTACKPADKKTEATPGAASSTASATPGQPGQPGQTPAASSPTFNLNPAANPAAATMTADKMPDVVAKVNGQAIKKDDLLKGAQVVQMQLAQRGQPVALTPDVYRRVLDELIGITLLQQEAKAQHIGPTEQELDKQVAARKKQFPSEEVYQKALKQTGLTEALLRQQTRDQLAVQKYVETQVISKAPVSDQATKDFYDKNKDQIHSPDRMHLRHILVAVKTTATPAEREKAKA